LKLYYYQLSYKGEYKLGLLSALKYIGGAIRDRNFKKKLVEATLIVAKEFPPKELYDKSTIEITRFLKNYHIWEFKIPSTLNANKKIFVVRDLRMHEKSDYLATNMKYRSAFIIGLCEFVSECGLRGGATELGEIILFIEYYYELVLSENWNLVEKY
jgi:hypothetical protein